MREQKSTVVHRYTGETITFLDVNPAYTLIEVTLPPEGNGPPLHYHDHFTEEFSVLKGQLTLAHNGKEQQVTAGESIFVPVGDAHTFTNQSVQPVTFTVKLTPGTGFEQSVRIHYGLMDDGLTDNKGNPRSLFHVAYILQLQNTLIAGMPLWVQRLLFGSLLRLGRWRGIYRKLDKYVQTED